MCKRCSWWRNCFTPGQRPNRSQQDEGTPQRTPTAPTAPSVAMCHCIHKRWNGDARRRSVFGAILSTHLMNKSHIGIVNSARNSFDERLVQALSIVYEYEIHSVNSKPPLYLEHFNKTFKQLFMKKYSKTLELHFVWDESKQINIKEI
jgi:hypothetical protein